jgi:hypothetical protein
MKKVSSAEIRRVMSELGKRTSPRKAKAAKENGKKGGRPPNKQPSE